MGFASLGSSAQDWFDQGNKYQTKPLIMTVDSRCCITGLQAVGCLAAAVGLGQQPVSAPTSGKKRTGLKCVGLVAKDKGVAVTVRVWNIVM